MKKIVLFCIGLLLLSAAPALAQGKVGVVNTELALEKTNAGERAGKELQAKFDSMKADLERMKAEIDKMREDMQKQSMALSLEAKQEKELEFKRKVRDLQDTNQAYQQKMAMERDKQLQPLLKKMGEVVRAYGKANGYDVIFEQNPRISGVLYFSETVDLTQAIVEEFNKVQQ